MPKPFGLICCGKPWICSNGLLRPMYHARNDPQPSSARAGSLGMQDEGALMLTLYHAPQSRSTRIIWLLEELGAEYNLIYTNIPRMDGSGGPDENNPHPDKKVPALAHNGALIT